MNNTEITLVAPCPPGWIGSFYSCYWIRKDCKKWKDASQFCKSATNGVHLVDINTEEEFQFISTHLRSQNDFSMLWTGLNDIEVSWNLCYFINIVTSPVYRIMHEGCPLEKNPREVSKTDKSDLAVVSLCEKDKRLI